MNNNYMPRAKRLSSYTREQLMEEYPSVAKAFDELIATNKTVRVKYWGRYGKEYEQKKIGHVRKVTIGSILECLTDYGYKVQIRVTKPEHQPSIEVAPPDA